VTQAPNSPESLTAERPLNAPKQNPQTGRIDVICGCMFAGKTARLIERLQQARAAGRRVIAFKHAIDDRYAKSELATHDDRRFPAIPVPDARALAAQAGTADVIGIDEAHFFKPDLADVCEQLRRRGVCVIASAIDFGAWGHSFPTMDRLKETANDVEVLRIPCTVCGAPARFSQRMTPIVADQIVGGPGDYEPRCERCFEPLPDTTPEPEIR